MDMVLSGLAMVMQPANFLYMLGGTFVGIVFAAMPGINGSPARCSSSPSPITWDHSLPDRAVRHVSGKQLRRGYHGDPAQHPRGSGGHMHDLRRTRHGQEGAGREGDRGGPLRVCSGRRSRRHHPGDGGSRGRGIRHAAGCARDFHVYLLRAHDHRLDRGPVTPERIHLDVLRPAPRQYRHQPREPAPSGSCSALNTSWSVWTSSWPSWVSSPLRRSLTGLPRISPPIHQRLQRYPFGASLVAGDQGKPETQHPAEQSHRCRRRSDPRGRGDHRGGARLRGCQAILQAP